MLPSHLPSFAGSRKVLALVRTAFDSCQYVDVEVRCFQARFQVTPQQKFPEISRNASHDTSLFRRLVLGWIEADFRVQGRIFFSIFQNLQENHLLASKFWKFLLKNWKFLPKF